MLIMSGYTCNEKALDFGSLWTKSKEEIGAGSAEKGASRSRFWQKR